jgi:hypothetical protein
MSHGNGDGNPALSPTSVRPLLTPPVKGDPKVGSQKGPEMEMRTWTVGAGVAVRNATPADFPRVAHSIASAFFDNPITIWHVPDESRRLDVMRDFFTVLLENVYTRFGLVFTNVGEVASGAMLIAAQEDRRPMPGLPLLECRTCNTPRAPDRVPRNMIVPPDTSAELDRALAVVFRDFPRTFELFELFDAHHPQDPHYYLQLSGCAPNARTQGSGRRSYEPYSTVATSKALPCTWRLTRGADTST